MTLRQFTSPSQLLIPAATAWHLADLAEARGKEQLLGRRSPQKLKVLRNHALVESAVSSTRIEGVQVAPARVGAIMFGRPLLRDRDEQELKGYRDALQLIHEQADRFQVSEDTIRRLHHIVRAGIGDAGVYRKRDSDIIERSPQGRVRVRFRTVAARSVPGAMRTLMSLWDQFGLELRVQPLLGLIAFNLDFLCIHPFQDGNGRVSRLLLLLQCYHQGYGVGRYISLERLIEENRERYYEALESSSIGWHEGKHDPWPYVNFVLYMLKLAYRAFDDRLEGTSAARGAKTAVVEDTIAKFARDFTLAELEQACPDISRDMIRWVLRDLKKKGKVDCLGRGPGARWRKRGNSPKRG